MIEQSMLGVGFLSGILAAMAVQSVLWARRYAIALAEKDTFVAQYADAAVAALDDPKTEEPFRRFLFAISPWIESRKIADAVCEPGIESRERNPNGITAKMLDHLPDERKIAYFGTLYYFLMALSYASHDGWRLRKRFAKASGRDHNAMYHKAAKAMSRAELCLNP